ncbi:glycosyltransferase family 9 protein [Sporocytophaga myxococcoides]|uniref:glycosyltransferase family 9 protein n=1 Tax=Sporocytophaga myxococcoides TaxID=153721 RepID=UPI00048C49DD|nr:glycosyltransferase family 9 protein [Sporocytophaga myxococcoides]
MKKDFKRILIIQTAFLGDVILATPLVEKLHRHYPNAQIDFLVKKGNESLLNNNPILNEVLVFEKKDKLKNLTKIISKIRSNKYDLLINLHRFGSSGVISFLSGAKYKIGFDKNPFAFCYNKRITHQIVDNTHEVSRNLSLIEDLTDSKPEKPRLYFSKEDEQKVQPLKDNPYLCMAPASVWFTKQFPEDQWVELMNGIDSKYKIYLLGGPGDSGLCNSIINKSENKNIESLAGKLSLLQSCTLMKDAVLNYVNDSGPLHLASSVNANVCAIFCSTVPSFGFGPLSDFSRIVQMESELQCRPCNLHGYKACPQGHFKCAKDIRVEQLLKVLSEVESSYKF